MKRFYSLLFVAISSLVVGCGTGNKPVVQAPAPTTPNDSTAGAEGTGGNATTDKGADAEVIDLEPIRIEVVGRDRIGDPELQAFDAHSLLDSGNAAMAEDRYDDAIGHYEKLLTVFPESRLAPSAIYNIGLAHEGKRDYDAAIAQYRTLARDPKLKREAIEAHMRIGGILSELRRWADASEALREVLARTDLTHSDKVEAMARLGYVALEQKDYTNAESVLSEAIAYYEKLTTGLTNNYFIAMSHYYLAQIPHRQFRAWPMRLPDAQLKKDFATKEKLVKLAYDRYLATVQIQHAYWATAAGFQLSQINKEFWDDIVLAPVPTELSPEAASIYVRELHQQTRILLQNAVNGHSKNVELSEAYRTATPWSDASRKQASIVAEILARESGGELVTPKKRDQPADQVDGKTDRFREYMPRRVDL